MKKTLIVLAIIGSAGMAHAQSSVTIYGVVQPSYDYVTVKNNNGLAADNYKSTVMQSNASRIGFMGQEDLGGGLKASFKLESEFDMVNDAGFSASNRARDTYVGLKGGFGEVQFGNIDSVYKSISAAYDPFEDTIGDYNSIMGNIGNGWNIVEDYSRLKQAANYYSPVFSGFQLQASYGLTQAQVNTAHDTTAYNLAVVYNNGPLNVLATYGHQNRASTNDWAFWKVGAAYTFSSNTTVRALYEKAKVDNYASTSHWLLGVEQKCGAVTLMANYINAGDLSGIAQSGATAYNLGVKYDLSKRTNIMGVYAYLKNDSAADYTSGDGTYGSRWSAVGGDKISGFSVRLQHKF